MYSNVHPEDPRINEGYLPVVPFPDSISDEVYGDWIKDMVPDKWSWVGEVKIFTEDTANKALHICLHQMYVNGPVFLRASAPLDLSEKTFWEIKVVGECRVEAGVCQYPRKLLCSNVFPRWVYQYYLYEEGDMTWVASEWVFPVSRCGWKYMENKFGSISVSKAQPVYVLGLLFDGPTQQLSLFIDGKLRHTFEDVGLKAPRDSQDEEFLWPMLNVIPHGGVIISSASVQLDKLRKSITSLQGKCIAVIRNNCRKNDVDSLPLPDSLKTILKQH